jgi:transposase-like protein
MHAAAENGRMRSKKEIRRLVEGFATSGKTRREYCAEHGISITTLDYWRRKHQLKPKLMEVAIEPQQAGSGFVLVLANGRRIESSWRFAEADLLRLIRAAEA